MDLVVIILMKSARVVDLKIDLTARFMGVAEKKGGLIIVPSVKTFPVLP